MESLNEDHIKSPDYQTQAAEPMIFSAFSAAQIKAACSNRACLLDSAHLSLYPRLCVPLPVNGQD